ncbi:MAG: DUF4105 domain-containing protein, partial [Bacteriovoracaceae bacterium]|nr:DUF4105 domain-containing protein [Bacteriovoracaceae bacterium]
MKMYLMGLSIILSSLLTFTPLLAASESYIDKAIKLKLWEDKHWGRLLHYKENSILSTTSQADGESFFLSKNGKESKKAELFATIRGVLNSSLADDNTHPICRFPARFLWLSKKLKINNVAPSVKCSDYKRFVATHDAQSASVVFSSYHLDSPASAYGHTLLRLNKGNHPLTGKHHELLDYGINYAANTTTDNAFVYSILGLIGGFKGTFASVPYFYKIREYNDFESRDLWSYNLKMNPDELNMLVAHIWELGSTYFDYFYFNENCSYHILSLLEAVNPNWNLLETLPFWVVPSESIKSFYNVEGLVESIDFRPSLRRRLRSASSQLSADELARVLRLDGERNFDALKVDASESNTKILDALIDYVDYRYVHHVLTEKGKHYLWKNKVLQKRSLFRGKGIDQNIPAPMQNAPHLSHSQHRLTTEVGNNEDGKFQTMSLRLSYHDLLDPRIGMPQLSQIEMVRFNFRYRYDKKEFLLDEFTAIEVESLNPWDSFSKKMSFRAKIGAKNYNLDSCKDCFSPSVELSSGATFKFGNRISVISSVLFDTQIAYNTKFNRTGLYLAIGPTVRSIFWWGDSVVTEARGSVYQSPTQKN